MNTVTNAPSQKARRDVLHCTICGKRFGSNDIRQNVYKDERLIGVIHDFCYDDYFVFAS